MNRREIAFNYLRSWLLLDLLASFPFSWLTDDFFTEEPALPEVSDSGMLQVLKVLRFLRLFKMMRLAKIARIMVTIEDYISSFTLSNWLSVVKLIFPIFFIVHWTACVWYYIGDSEGLSAHATWLNYNVNAPERNKSLYDRYIAALYWAVTTIATVGYGDIVPITVGEKVFASFIMVLACGIFAFTLANVGGLVNYQTKESSDYRRQTAQVNYFLKSKNIPPELQAKAKRYIEYRWSIGKKRLDSEKDFMSALSEPLRNEINLHILGRVIITYNFFRQFQASFLTLLTKQLKYEFFAPRDVIFSQGEVGDKMYFIKTGTVEIYEMTSETTFNIIKQGGHFGEIGFLIGFPRCLSTRTSEYSELLSIDTAALYSCMDRFPSASVKLRHVKETCKGGNLKKIGVRCYCCRVRGHVAVNCTELQLGLGERKG